MALGLASRPLLVILPALGRRRRLTRWVGRSVLTLMGMPLRVHFCGPLPDPCIVVANHCSYLDGVVLTAALPPRFGFVIKREMSSVPLAGLLLTRIGSPLVPPGKPPRRAPPAPPPRPTAPPPPPPPLLPPRPF